MQTLPAFKLEALRILPDKWANGWELRPCPVRRGWMDQNTHAYQCLPLVVANQWGWEVLSPTDVKVAWDGGERPTALSVQVDPQFAPAVKSQFGSGIVTFSPPWLFRTPDGWDLYCKGPSNRFKANCAPLEGIIETWWLNYTFTLNWKLIEPGEVRFEKGESLAQLVPVPHQTFAGSSARESPIGLAEPEAAKEMLEWLAERRRIRGEASTTHSLYRSAEGVENHLTKVGVPKVVPWDEEGRGSAG